uniref:Bm14188 n=1 Tax=Brugia malayi TaxID=6279 RepID=A0A1I9G1R2_BRUMA|nr:Bm14188 [Brugia malayi]
MKCPTKSMLPGDVLCKIFEISLGQCSSAGEGIELGSLIPVGKSYSKMF